MKKYYSLKIWKKTANLLLNGNIYTKPQKINLLHACLQSTVKIK